jgi:integrase
MGSIRVRQGRYQANIRRRGYAPVTKTFTSRDVAKQFIKSTEIAMERGDYAPRSSMTVGELMQKYENEYLPTLKNGGDSHKWRVRLLKRYFKDLPLADLTPAHLAKYRDERLHKVTPLTVKRDLSVLSSAINTAVIEWSNPLDLNPVSRIRFKNADVPRDRRLQHGEEQLLLSRAYPCLKRQIIVAIETAMRQGEIYNIRKCDINFQNQTLRIPETKTDKPRTIPLSKRALKALTEQMRASGNVAHMTDKPIFDVNRWTEWNRFTRLKEECGIEDLRFHDLRHEATSRLFERGFNVMEVASITGHENLKHLKRYTHIKPESLVARLG